MSYEEQAERALRQAEKNALFGARYGRVHDAFVATPREAAYVVWVLTHPFGPDLAACAETNS